jgi:DNA polymerase/3'-5' exonuclease PolX
MRYYPQDQYPFALLFLTGNKVFNHFLRIKAKSRGYCLSDNSLKNAKGEKIPCKTEE